MARALIVVDVQPTFCEGGALPVPGGDACAKRIAAFARAHRDAYDLIVTTQDWHVDPGPHFSAHPDFVNTWPPHGVAGTAEAELHPALEGLHADIAVKKGEYQAAYSGFEGHTPDGTPLADILRENGIDRADVVGLAESHCVCQTALDAVDQGLEVRVFEDLTEPVSPQTGQAARGKMREAGVHLCDSHRAFAAAHEDEGDGRG